MKQTKSWIWVSVALLLVLGVGLNVSAKWFVTQQTTQFRQVYEALSVPPGLITQSPGSGVQEYTP